MPPNYNTVYDVFISYRRTTGEMGMFPLFVRDRLEKAGYKAFLDLEDLGGGKFNERLITVIENSPHFISVLTKDSLNRCVNEDDWVRKEIACALSNGKNIVPLMEEGFNFPETLPEDIDDIRNYNGIRVPVMKEYLGAMIDKLAERLTLDGKRGNVNPLPQTFENTGNKNLLYQTPENPDNETCLAYTDVSPKFLYKGAGKHPNEIGVNIPYGARFTIGRFDTFIGTKQSDFEFEPKTKAVSRRHAVIERKTDNGCYYITDLNSSAGTFVNGNKLIPDKPFKLENGFNVSFGHLGADYVWEG